MALLVILPSETYSSKFFSLSTLQFPPLGLWLVYAISVCQSFCLGEEPQVLYPQVLSPGCHRV